MGKNKSVHRKITWKCDMCESIQTSYSNKRWDMDVCKCGKSGYDLEEFYSRTMGKISIISEEEIQEENTIKLSENDSKIFINSILNPEEPNEKLKKTFENYKIMKRSTEEEIKWKAFLYGSIVGILAGIGICGLIFLLEFI